MAVNRPDWYWLDEHGTGNVEIQIYVTITIKGIKRKISIDEYWAVSKNGQAIVSALTDSVKRQYKSQLDADGREVE